MLPQSVMKVANRTSSVFIAIPSGELLCSRINFPFLPADSMITPFTTSSRLVIMVIRRRLQERMPCISKCFAIPQAISHGNANVHVTTTLNRFVLSAESSSWVTPTLCLDRELSQSVSHTMGMRSRDPTFAADKMLYMLRSTTDYKISVIGELQGHAMY